MSWYIRFFLVSAGMAGAVQCLLAQVQGFSQAAFLPVSICGSGCYPWASEALRARESTAWFYGGHSSLYGIRGLSSSAFAGGIPVHPGMLSLSCQHSGYSVYRETAAGLSYAMSFGKKVQAGMQLDYLRNRATDEDFTARAVTFSCGLLVEPVRNFLLGVHVFNPLQGGFAGTAYGHLPSVLQLAVGYRPGDKLLLMSELEKDVELTPVVKAAVEFTPSESLLLRFGVNSARGQFFGLQYNLRQASLEAGVFRHAALGYSVTGGFCWRFKGRAAA
jgi:hypothetical protein